MRDQTRGFIEDGIINVNEIIKNTNNNIQECLFDQGNGKVPKTHC